MKYSFATLLSGDLQCVSVILISVCIEPLYATVFKFSLRGYTLVKVCGWITDTYLSMLGPHGLGGVVVEGAPEADGGRIIS